jgi:hypothetical protein
VTIADAPPASAPTPQDQPMVLSQSSDELPKCVVPSVRRGRVIGLVTKAGSVRKPGTRIGVRVSSGRR